MIFSRQFAIRGRNLFVCCRRRHLEDAIPVLVMNIIILCCHDIILGVSKKNDFRYNFSGFFSCFLTPRAICVDHHRRSILAGLYRDAIRICDLSFLMDESGAHCLIFWLQLMNSLQKMEGDETRYQNSTWGSM
jgi:hypothetical protein